MTRYEFLLFLHIVFAILWLGAGTCRLWRFRTYGPAAPDAA